MDSMSAMDIIPNSSLDFLFVDDAAEALIKTADNIQRLKGEIINVCAGAPLTLLEASKIISRIAGREFADVGAMPYRKNEQMNYFGDSSKIRKLIGWQAKISFEEGIKRTLYPN